MADDNEWTKAPTEEKVEHKNWKARLAGYEECCKLFRMCDDPKNPVYLNYLGLVKKFVVDSNEVAKDKALDAVLAFVENVPAAAKTVGEVMPGLINKCLNGKAKTKEKAFEIIMMYIEAEKQELVSEELVKGLDNKQPKIVQACLEILRKAINEFSSKVIPIKPIIKFVPKLLEDRDKMVRDETKLLAIEMYRWAGAAIMPQLQAIRPALLQELEEEFKSAVANSEKPRQTRFLRSQQDLKAKMEAEQEQRMMNGGGGGDEAGVSGSDAGAVESVSEAMDPYDLMEPCEILSKLPKDFKEKLEAKKWQERKEVLDNLHGILQKNPRLVIVDYYDLVNDLKKLVAKDANVNIVIVAAKCITGIAAGVRKDFSKYALLALEPLMERFKEKKQNVVDALREACDAIYPSTNLEVIQEVTIGFLGHKTPVVRQQVALFLAKCFAMSTQTTLPKKVLKVYLVPLLKNLGEADPSVREASSEALGSILKALGEKIFMPMAGEVEQIKLDKIKEYADKCVLLNMRGEPRQVASAPVAKPAVSSTSSINSATMVKKPIITKPSGNTEQASKAKPQAVSKPNDAAKKVVKGGAGPASDSNAKKMPEEPDLSQETVEDKANELFGAETITNLANSNWKERQSAIENLTNSIKRMPTDEVPCQVIVRTVAKKPGFKDPHFQVLKQRLELITMIADTGYKFSQRSASYCLVDIADKIGDAKTSQQSKDALSKIGEQCTLPYVISQISGPIFVDGKNPKNQENFLTWLSQAIKEFGFQGVDMKTLLQQIKSALQNTNPAVRVASIQLISTIYMYAGPSFRGLFDQEKPALLEQIDAEIEKVKALKPPAPIRGKNLLSAQSGSAQNGDENDADQVEDDPMQQQLQQEALMPRTDISSQLSDQLMEQLNDKNWKERQAALEKLEAILRDNKFIEPNLNEFPTNLNKRLVDTNKILATTALKICEKLAQALGSQGKRFVATLAPGMIGALSDNKETLRKTAISALNAWFDSCGGLVPFLENDLLMESFSTATNPNIKAELCGWLASVLPKCKQGKLPPELKALIPTVYTFVEDRNPEVRSKAQELILPLMTHVGPNDMLRVMQKAKPTSLTVLQPLVEKARAELAAKQPAPVPVVSKPTTARVVKPPIKDLYADDDTNGDDYSTPSTAASSVKKDSKPAVNAKATNNKEQNGKGPASSSSASTNGTASKKGKNEDEEVGPILQISNKQKRIEEEKALKTLKWNFDVPRKEFIEQLQTQMEQANFNRTLMSQLFHADFKYQIMALQSLTKAIDELSDATLSNLDLILRWLTLRFFETNPTVILKAIEYMQSLFQMLATVKNYNLVDYEANAFLPYFIVKLGDPKDPIRKGFRTIIKQIAQIYAPVKIFNFLVQGLVSKNSRQRAECLEELGQMIEALGLNSFNPSVTLKEIAKQIGDRDTSVRNAALNTITIAWQIGGEQVYKFVGKLNEKDQSMLDERIKRSSKSVPSSSSGVKSSISGPINPQNQHSQMPNSSSYTTGLSGQQQNQINNTNGNHNGSNDEKTNGMNNGSQKPSSATMTRTTPTKRINSVTQLTQNISPSPPQINAKPKGEFSLDLKDDENDNTAVYEVKLTPHQDLDDLLNPPICLPPRKNTTHYPVNILKESQDCKEAIDLVITHISHQQIDISFQNLIQIDFVIKDKEKRELLVPHIDNLLNTCAIKLNVSHNIYLPSHDCQVDEVFKLFKGLFSVIIDIFDNGLGKYASIKTLKDVFYNLLSVMTDSNILKYPDGDQLIKAINIVTLKLLELSNQTTSYCALVKLLTDCCDQENLSSKYLELVMKCIWRQIRRLSSANSNDQQVIQQIETAKVLNEINLFLKTYPSSSWQNKPSDLPLRTVKTLLFHLAKARQSEIIDDLNEINASEDSEIKVYIMKLFKNGFQLTNAAGNNSNINMTNVSFGYNGNNGNKTMVKSNKNEMLSPESANNSNPPSSQRIKTAEQSDRVSAIIKKIVDQQDIQTSNISETTKESLRELYDLKREYPEIDLNKYFLKSSGTLYFHIQEHFKNIELEANGKKSSNSEKQLTTNSSNYFDDIKPEKREMDDIMKKINDWKSKTHLNKLDDDNDENNLRNVNMHSNSNYSNSSNPLLSQYQSNDGKYSRHTALSGFTSNLTNGSSNIRLGSTHLGSNMEESDGSIKAEKYLDFVKDYKKKYQRSRTESDQCNDLKQLDLKAKNLEPSNNFHQNQPGISSTSKTQNGESNSININNGSASAATTTQSKNFSENNTQENLYDEYKRRLELIKKINPIK